MYDLERDMLLGLLFLLAGLLGFIIHIGKLRRRRQIEDTPSSRVRSAAQGKIKLQGYAWPCYKQAKQTCDGTLAVWRQLKVVISRGRRTHQLVICQEGSPFLFTDLSGAYAIIDARQCKREITSYSVVPQNVNSIARQAINRALAAKGYPTINFNRRSIFRAKHDIIESAILVGSPVYIEGYFKSPSKRLIVDVANGLHKYEAALSTLNPNRRMIPHWDVDRDGELSPDEITLGLYRVTRLLRRGLADAPLAVECEGSVVAHRTSPLFISDRHQASLLATALVEASWAYILIPLGLFIIGALLLSTFR